MKDEGFYAERAIQAGARGFLSKSLEMDQTLVALRKIMEGGIYLSEGVASRIISRVAGSSSTPRGVDALTDREVTVLELIGAGLPARQIAKRLHISPKTVDSHREHIKSKLKLSDAAALNRFAVEWIHQQDGSTP
jgi:DNA-binding NarL/FixJ family response regulator